MNRINTPFEMVAVKDSGNEHTIVDLDGGMVFVTINTYEPVSLMVYEEGVTESMFSVMLQPLDVPPVMIDANVRITPSMIAKSKEFQRELEINNKLYEAEQMEYLQTQASEHEQRIKEILRPIANGEVPRGFTFTTEIPRDQTKKPCSINIYQDTRQRLIGAREIVDVVLVKNDSKRPYRVREQHCLANDSIAVAILDKALLMPGEQTELYILKDKLYQQNQSKARRRPRLTQGGV